MRACTFIEPPAFLEVPGPCDLSCAWCNLGGVAAVPSREDLARITARLEALARQGHRVVGFGYRHTEPTTHPDLVVLVERARALGFARITLATSGMAIGARGTLRGLVAAGVTDVNLTVPTLDPALGDALLGAAGATEAKLRALEVCLEEGLAVVATVMLLRPALHRLADDVAGLARVPRERRRHDRLTVHGCLMDSVPGLEPGRFTFLWPRAGEVAWAVKRARARVAGFETHARDLPLCLAERIPGLRPVPFVRAPDERAGPECDGCDRAPRCAGFSPEYPGPRPRGRGALPGVEPPRPDLAALERALDRARGLAGAGERRPRGPAEQPAWQRAVLRRLAPLLAGDRRLAGFGVCGVRRDAAFVSLAMVPVSGVPVEVFVERAADAARSFAAGRRFAISYRGSRPDAGVEALLRALLEVLERPAGGAASKAR